MLLAYQLPSFARFAWHCIALRRMLRAGSPSRVKNAICKSFIVLLYFFIIISTFIIHYIKLIYLNCYVVDIEQNFDGFLLLFFFAFSFFLLSGSVSCLSLEAGKTLAFLISEYRITSYTIKLLGVFAGVVSNGTVSFILKPFIKYHICFNIYHACGISF